MRAFLVLATIAALVPACRKKAPPLTVGLALGVGGRRDQSFNDGTLRGLENMAAGLRYTPRGYEPLPDPDYRLLLPPDLRSRPFPHLGIPPPIVLQGKAQEDYEPNLRLLAAQGAELVVAVGFMMEPATRKVARDNPRTNFLLIDSPILDEAGRPSTLPNVRAVVFRENEGTFLAGAVAGEITRTGKVGFVGGMQLPLIQKFEVVFYESARDVVQEKFTGGDVVLGLAEGAMGLVPLSVSTFPTLRAMGLRDPQDLTAIVIDVQTLQHAVMTRRIAVPATLEELKAFPPPDPAVTGNLRAAKR